MDYNTQNKSIEVFQLNRVAVIFSFCREFACFFLFFSCFFPVVQTVMGSHQVLQFSFTVKFIGFFS